MAPAVPSPVRFLPALVLPLALFQPAFAREKRSWQPAAEPPRWAEVRRTLLRIGPPQGLAPRSWLFLRALDRDELRAGEYIADLRATEGASGPVATFTGAVLLQRPAGGDSPWRVRERSMRLLCRLGRMEVRSPAGAWTAYTGATDPETPARRAWICDEARRRSGAAGAGGVPSAR